MNLAALLDAATAFTCWSGPANAVLLYSLHMPSHYTTRYQEYNTSSAASKRWQLILNDLLLAAILPSTTKSGSYGTQAATSAASRLACLLRPSKQHAQPSILNRHLCCCCGHDAAQPRTAAPSAQHQTPHNRQRHRCNWMQSSWTPPLHAAVLLLLLLPLPLPLARACPSGDPQKLHGVPRSNCPSDHSPHSGSPQKPEGGHLVPCTY